MKLFNPVVSIILVNTLKTSALQHTQFLFFTR